MKFRSLIFLSILGFTGEAFSQGVARCEEDMITTDAEQRGRNGWARKCSYITPAMESTANSLKMYWVFKSDAPKTEGADCIGGLTMQAMCATGCFTPSQSIISEGEVISIGEAAGQKRASVAGLEKDYSLGEQSVMQFVKGEETGTIYVISTEDHSIEVTTNHPMVLGSGEVVPASELKVGGSLLSTDLEATKITNIEEIPYNGTVWNVLLDSQEKEHNIIASEGLLTGSLKFQNQWADEYFRLALRNNIDVSGI